ncbi:hypothetical protein [Phosphitispora fastidiosa]|uniref:hypothetical protein n=1 Tax=Phosphitispora fastidiosa TaxID=2837202 RepID=UPI001E30C17C|nr:hypothetical protein [Phosphitispora fastidiosa]MBU7008789.1 hypothetical protein [Phosphitispora fastidiosa]
MKNIGALPQTPSSPEGSRSVMQTGRQKDTKAGDVKLVVHNYVVFYVVSGKTVLDDCQRVLCALAVFYFG